MIVKPGETYTDLAERLGLDPFELKMANGFAQLNPGMDAKEPKPGRGRRDAGRGESIIQGSASQPPASLGPGGAAGQGITVASGGRRKSLAESLVAETVAGGGRAKSGYESGLVSTLASGGLQRPLGRIPRNPVSGALPSGGVVRDPGRSVVENSVSDTRSSGGLQRERGRFSERQPGFAAPGQPAGQVGASSGGITPAGRAGFATQQPGRGAGYESQTVGPGRQNLQPESFDYLAHFENGLLDLFLGNVTAKGPVRIPLTWIGMLDVNALDPAWVQENADRLIGLDKENMTMLWLAELGYEVSEMGDWMVFNPNSGELNGDNGRNDGGSFGGGGGFRRYGGGGGSYGKSFYNNATAGLVNWRGVGFA